jgi:aromatic ring-opening dioxygenase catalytic subunit (LigB family)
MAEFAGSFAASHGPLIARDWAKLSPEIRADLQFGFDQVAARIVAARPDILLIVSPDHWVNFFITNLPAFCLGIGATHKGPPEPFLADFPHKSMAGHPAFARHLIEQAFNAGFDPALSHELVLDHGFCIPLLRMGLSPLPAIVPLIINDLEPPMPTIARCIQWGALIRQAIDSFPGTARIGVLGTGGLSHSIGETTMGIVDEAFDHACIAQLRSGDMAAFSAWAEEALTRTGNGAHEIRDWAVAHGAAGGTGFELLHYAPTPEVYVGCAFAAWQ